MPAVLSTPMVVDGLPPCATPCRNCLCEALIKFSDGMCTGLDENDSCHQCTGLAWALCQPIDPAGGPAARALVEGRRRGVSGQEEVDLRAAALVAYNLNFSAGKSKPKPEVKVKLEFEKEFEPIPAIEASEVVERMSEVPDPKLADNKKDVADAVKALVQRQRIALHEAVDASCDLQQLLLLRRR